MHQGSLGTSVVSRLILVPLNRHEHPNIEPIFLAEGLLKDLTLSYVVHFKPI